MECYFLVSGNGIFIGYFKIKKDKSSLYLKAHRVFKKHFPHIIDINELRPSYRRCSVLDNEDFETIDVINFDKKDSSNYKYLEILRKHNLIIEKDNGDDVFISKNKSVGNKTRLTNNVGDVYNDLLRVKKNYIFIKDGDKKIKRATWICECLKCKRILEIDILHKGSKCYFCSQENYGRGDKYYGRLIINKMEKEGKTYFKLRCTDCMDVFIYDYVELMLNKKCATCGSNNSNLYPQLSKARKRYLDRIFGHLRRGISI